MFIDNIQNYFSMACNMMKIKYVDLSKYFDNLLSINRNDKINVFINLDTVFNFFTNVQNIEININTEYDYEDDIVTDILNLAAHYKRFFRDNKLDTKVFLYMTDFKSDNYNQSKLLSTYRKYYYNKFNINPKYNTFTEKLINKIIPDVKVISDYIENVYLLKGLNIESSLIPKIISDLYNDRKNVIISGDLYDTQYMYYDNFNVFLIKKSKSIITRYIIKDIIEDITKRELSNYESSILTNSSFYTLILSSIGNKYRNIESIDGLGPIGVIQQLLKGIEANMLTLDTKSIEILSSIFNNKNKLIDNYNLFSIDYNYLQLTLSQKETIYESIVDKFDNNSLLKLNSTRFYNNQLNLEALTK